MLPFIGIPIAFVGDPGQTSPVGGNLACCSKTSINIHVQGSNLFGNSLYMDTKPIMKLTVGVRQRGVFMRLLLRLRDGNSTEDDWKMLITSCTEQYLDEDQV